jgi:hypothetical protein
MLNESKLPDTFWRDVVYTIVHILSRAQLIFNHDKTPYELWFGRPTSVKHFKSLWEKMLY